MAEQVNSFQEFLDSNQYSRNSILRYERIFGHTWVSTGGETTAKDFCLHLYLKPGQKVLDVGCGTGGSAFFLARQYGVTVEGIDLSKNMLQIAEDRLRREEQIIQDRVKFKFADVTEIQYPSNCFDVIYSKDVLAHNAGTETLFKTMQTWLKPGGYLLISDYCRGEQPGSEEFKEYVTGRGYYLHTVKEYGDILQQAGFKNVNAIDISVKFLEILQSELKYFIPTKESFIQDFSATDYDDVVESWRKKLVRVSAGYLAWGLFTARK